ncbi:hypothetical protein LTR17_003852 [Elasticomyces elasticus]|nr:hypothetical protein LTR17_003852 [Elasticomyces elasticus]
MADSHATPSQPDPATPGLMRLPAELRVTIYRMVFANMHSLYLNQGSPIVLIYAEAAPIFWGEIFIDLNLEPSFFAPGTSNPYDLEVLGSWIVRSGIRSIRSRRKVKTLSFRAWCSNPDLVWSDRATEHCMDWWRKDCSKDPSVSGLDGFENVTSLNVELYDSATHWSGFPSRMECDTIVAGLPQPECYDASNLLDTVTSFRESTIATLGYLLPKLPRVKTVTFSGWSDPAMAGLTWFGSVLQPLRAENSFFQQLKDVTSKYNCHLVVNMREIYGPGCFLCGQAWSLGHWSPLNPAGECSAKNDPEIPHTANEQRGDLYFSKWEQEEDPTMFLVQDYGDSPV